MTTSNTRPSTVGWFQITAVDPAPAQKFYQELFGWDFDPEGADDSYWTITAPGAATSMGALRRGEHDGLCPGVVCAGAAATTMKLESLGSRVVEPPERTPAGDVHAVVTAARTNRLGLFEPAAPGEPVTPGTPPAPNSAAWFEIGTTDLSVTRAFYEKAFGWTLERDEAAEGVAYYGIVPAGATDQIGGVLDVSAMDGLSDYAIPGLCVADVPDLLERCVAAGGTHLMGPVSDANGLVIGQFLDPVGNRWSAFALPSVR